MFVCRLSSVVRRWPLRLTASLVPQADRKTATQLASRPSMSEFLEKHRMSVSAVNATLFHISATTLTD